ncbi:MAG: EthD family reductase [Microbacteriaceae bacterium]
MTLKAVALVRRARALEPERFHELLRQRGSVGHDGVVGHVQSHVRPAGYRRGEPAVDAVVELWLADGFAPSIEELCGRGAVLGEDICERSQLALITTVEHIVKDGPRPPGGVKNIEIVHRRRDLPPTEFHRYWRERHGPLAATIGPILRYVQSHAVDDPASRPFDGIASTWFHSTAAMRESALTAEYAATRADEENFLVEPLPFVITDEVTIVEPPAGRPPTRERD